MQYKVIALMVVCIAVVAAAGHGRPLKSVRTGNRFI